MEERNSLLTLPSFERQRGHSSLSNARAGLYTVRRQVGQFRYAKGVEAYPASGGASTNG
jgi:hypothetical protein